MKVITKHIISDGFTLDDSWSITTRDELCELIDRWKYLFVSKGAKRGNSLGVSMLMVDANHIAVLFAAAELGLSLAILDKPVVEETINRTKAAIFGGIDFHVACKYAKTQPNYLKMLDRYVTHNIWEDEIDQVTETYREIHCQPDDVYLISTSSGTTGKPKTDIFSHKRSIDLLLRNVDIFKYEKTSKVCHTRNMNHVSSMLIGLMPTFYACDKHYFFNIYGNPENFPRYIKDNQIDRVFIGSEFVVRDLVKNATQQNIRFDTTVFGSISGFPLPASYVDYCRDLNMELFSHIGSAGVGVVILLNHMTANTIHEENLLGVTPDDYYRLELENGITWVSSKFDNYATRNIQEDHLLCENGKWYYNGRTSKNPLEDEIRDALGKNCNTYHDFLVIWDSDPIDIPEKFRHLKTYYLNKELWTTETKVNTYQLMGYLELQEELKAKGLPLSIEPKMKESLAAMKNTA